MKIGLPLCLLLSAASFIMLAEDRDFLTSNEVDQIREAQDPNERLQLYLRFAKLRIELLEQALAKDKPGRSLTIHNTLEDYKKIIEAVDSVADDALRRKQPIDKGMAAVASAEQEFLAKLNKIEPSEPKDLGRYQFVLQEAIDATSDSRELSLEDSQKRTTELAAGDAKEKKDREAAMPTKEVKERKQADAAADDQKKKIPSLYKPGEKPQQPPQ
jgi:hypothetical protein